MRLLVDAQLPPALARVLAEHGHDAEHVHDIGMASAPDRDLWHYALQHEAVLVTKDQDFINLSPLAELTPVVVWVRLGNTSRASLLAWFEPLIEQLVTPSRRASVSWSCAETTPSYCSFTPACPLLGRNRGPLASLSVRRA